DEDIIHVDDWPSFGNEVSESMVHECLERRGRVAKSKEHDIWFEETGRRNECCLPTITGFDLNVVISPMDVHLGEDLGSFQFVNKIRDERKGIGILYRVRTWVEGSVFLWNKEEGRSLERLRQGDLSSLKVFFNKLFAGFFFLWVQMVGLGDFRNKRVVTINSMV
ncbi:hypothetical protein PAXRUDRAFT_48165, partial [Paxillus rubicundulus Ve08.2h10]